MWKRTPLFAAHQRHGARLIEFGGWEMPVQYAGIVQEHLAVRNAAGLFDISHMGEFRIKGPRAGEFLNHALTNDISKLRPGTAQYTLMCNPKGGTIDDLYAYCLGEQVYLLVVNASRIAPDYAWLEELLSAWPRRPEVTLENASALLGAVAVQGPNVVSFIDHLFPDRAQNSGLMPSSMQKNQVATFDFGAQPVYVARTGYTGEDGFEIISPAGLIETLWDKIVATGKPHAIQPAGLGARDTLRMEACYPLYGHELDENITPLEAGLGFFVALDKPEFTGQAALKRQKAEGLRRKSVAFKMSAKSPPPRAHYAIWCAGEEPTCIGEVTSGTQSPSLEQGIGLGYIDAEHSSPGTRIDIEIRGRRFPAEIVRKPLYRRKP
jgi:aminomethyltransferase